ncbi:MAG: DUF1592 domain-containing protein [Polyangiaceae bacterium]|nr:DUF1592 domain-containing protein [Polyangiaceae bacterium]
MNRSMLSVVFVLLAVGSTSTACESGLDDDGTGGAPPVDDAPPPDTPRVRRLSNRELANTVVALTGVAPAALAQVPPDQRTFLFDRMAAAQTVSPSHVEAFTAIATQLHETLISEARLDEVASACTDELLPPAAANERVRVAGVAMIAEPEWARCPAACSLGPPLADDAVYLLYGNADETAVTTNFEAPSAGTYRLTLQLQTAVAGTVTLLVDGEQAASWPIASDGARPFELATTRELASGLHDLRYQFSDNGEVIHVLQLVGEGPIDGVDAPTERRACAVSIIDELGALAFRRPIKPEEHDRLLALYDTGVANGSFHDASRMLFEAIFGSPHFQFIVEIGQPEGRPGIYQLDDWELASRLSYALCEMPPDSDLRDAAARGELQSESTLREHAERLLDDACGRETIGRFYRQWLRTEQLVGLARDPAVFPAFDASTMPEAMLREADHFLSTMTFEEGATIVDLYRADQTWVDSTSAELYGLTVQGDELVRIDLPPGRRGLLTLPGLLTVTSKFSETSPVKRGAFVVNDLLCGEVPPPSGDLDVTPPAPDPSLTTRERWAAHSNDPACAGCHSRLDPVGFALDEFDAIGRLRVGESGVPVDSTGGIPDLGANDGTVVGGAQLSELIADSQDAVDCFARQWFRFASGRLEKDGSMDADALVRIAGADGAPPSLRTALLAYVESEAFRARIVPEEMEAP